MTKPLLSIVATMYRSAPYVDEFCDRITRAATAITQDFEIVLVNDGSPDDSLDLALKRRVQDSRVRVVDLSRNFGHHHAIMAGLDASHGQFVYLTDIDLEEQPEWIADFWQAARDGGHDVVFGVQRERIASPLSNLLASTFWWMLNIGSKTRITRDQMTCRLMTRQFVDSLCQTRDKVLYLGGVFSWVGFRQHALPLVKSLRPRGVRTTYGFLRKLSQAVDSITSFTAAPLTAFFLIGLVVWFGSITFGLWLIIHKIANPSSIQSGFTSLMFSLWFLGGLIIMGIGLVGQYVATLFQEVKDRPRYIVRTSEGADHDRGA